MLYMKGQECQQGLGPKEVEEEVEEEMEEMNLALCSSTPLPPPQEQDHLPSRDPLLPHLVPSPCPAIGEEKRSAWSRIAPWTGLEGI